MLNSRWEHCLATGELSVAQSHMTQRYCGHRIEAEDGDRGLDFRHSALGLGRASLHMLQYGGPVSIAARFDDFYMLEIPLAGGIDIEFGPDRFRSGVGLAFLLSPGPRFVSRWRPGTRQLMIQIGGEVVRDRMSRLARRAPAALPVFNPVLDPRDASTGALQEALAELTVLACENEAADSREIEPIIPRLVDGLLRERAFRQGESIVFERLHATPRQVKAVMDLFRARYGERLLLGEVAQEVGICERSLFEGFQRHYQRSPLAVLTDIRLEEARRLVRSGTGAAEAARRVGMRHVGRFSAAYRRAFGVLPSGDRG